MSVTLENQFVKYVIGDDGRNLGFVSKKDGVDHVVNEPPSPCALVRKGGEPHGAKRVSYADGRLTILFDNGKTKAVVKITTKSHYFVFDVESVSGDVDELTFVNLPTSLQVKADESFSAGTLALNLQTNVEELPGPQRHLWAACYQRFGFVGAQAGLVACPYNEMRKELKEMVGAAPGVPHSPLGGPWAMDSDQPYGSYLFGAPTEQDVDGWIELCHSLGFTQIDVCGSLNYGDYQPFPHLYPNGFKSVKTVLDKLHAAGILAGLHTLSFSIDKRCAWVTPVPHPQLAKERSYILGNSIAAADTTLAIDETTTDLPKYTNYYVRRSMTLQIDDELIEYSAVNDIAPYAVAGCKRGACGTVPAAHAKGAKAHHLKECWGCFLPDGDSPLFGEVADRIATVINECGFDFTYLDGLDGAHVIGGEENRWHYGTKFAFEVYRRFTRPIMMEMATFHHHLWFVRSRMQAWDHAVCGHKTFIDLHCASNEGCRRIFMPRHLGWSRVLAWVDHAHDVTFDDDVEYLWSKGLGTDAGYSLQSIRPETYTNEPWLRQVTPIIKTYETLRQQKYFPESVKEKLRVPGDEFALTRAKDGEWQFTPTRNARHKVENIDGVTNVWRSNNKFHRQPVNLRIQALPAAGPYGAAANLVLADFQKSGEFDDRGDISHFLNSGKAYSYPAAAPGLSAKIRPSSAEESDRLCRNLGSGSRGQEKTGAAIGCFTARNAGAAELICSSAPDDEFSLFDHAERIYRPRHASWVRLGKTFASPVELKNNLALGLWVHGDGQGELLNIRPRNTKQDDSAFDHYIVVDFTGWRYFELIEPEVEQFQNYSWPYGRELYTIYRATQRRPETLEGLDLWYNNVPDGRTVTCHLSPIKAMPLVTNKISHPSITVGERTITFPVEIESGCYLEFRGRDDCRLYNPRRELLQQVRPEGDIPELEPGDNQITFNCAASAVRPRANVTVITQGDTPLRR